MKFNMGCGLNRKAGYVNVDAAAESGADEVWDLEVTPWPWADDCAEEVLFIHSLEHMGGDPRVFMSIMQQLYRICRPGAKVVIHAPHPRHDDFLNDPTHVRAISPRMLSLFDRELNETWRENGAANSPLALYSGVDFRIAHWAMRLDEPYRSQHQAGELSVDAVGQLVRHQNNIAREFQITLEVRKP